MCFPPQVPASLGDGQWEGWPEQLQTPLLGEEERENWSLLNRGVDGWGGNHAEAETPASDHI